jgi:hypothetical protein
MSGPWEQFAQQGEAEDGPWSQFQQPQPQSREPSVADNIPGLNQANRAFESVRGLMQPPTPAKPTQPPGEQFSNLFNQGMDAMIPNTIPEAAAGFGLGKMAPMAGKALSAILGKMGASRPLNKELAQEAIAKLMPQEAREAKAWFKAMDEQPPTPRSIEPVRPGDMSQVQIAQRIASREGQSLNQMQQQLEKMRNNYGEILKKEPARAAEYERSIDEFKSSIDEAYPGFLKHQQGYADYKRTGRLQQMTQAENPLKSFEGDVVKGRIVGEGGEVLEQGGKLSRGLSEADQKEVRSILSKLGKEPGENVWKSMMEGRATGAMVGAPLGGILGYEHSGVQGAAAGALAGVAGPKAINAMITKALKHPSSRAFLKRSLDSGGIQNPRFWETLGYMTSRLGVDSE